ncbi:MAG TPA: tetratricopeptide repeat protein, partial [Rudaea sp.]|nr:tetratricopeptide repeat protein [Rudaea sp.]
AQALIHKSRYSEASALLAPLREEFIQQSTPTAIDALILLSKALVHSHRADDGLALARETVVLAQSKGIQGVNQVLEAMINEASNLIDMQRFQEGFRSADAALSLWHQTGETPSRQIITLYENTAVAAEANGDISRAEDSYKQAIALGNLFFDQPSPVIAWDTGLYGTFLVAQGRLDDAEPYLRDALDMRRKTFGEFDPHTLYAVAGMGKLDFAKGDFEKAADWYSQGIEVCRAHSVQSVICPRLFALRGRTYSQYGQFANADQDVQEAMQLQRKLSGEESLSYAYILENLIVVQLSQQQYKDALATADSVLELRKKLNGGMLQTALSTRFYRAEALLALDRVDDALKELLDIEGEYARLLPHGELQFGILAAQAKAFERLHRIQAAREIAKRALSVEQKGKNANPRIITDLKRIANPTT